MEKLISLPLSLIIIPSPTYSAGTLLAPLSAVTCPPQRNLLRLSMPVADGVPAWTALAVSMLPSPQTWNLEAMRSMRLLGWNILLAGAVLG